VKGRAVQEAEAFSEVSAKGLEKGRATMNARGHVGLARGRETEIARGYPGQTKARATQKVTGSSQLAKGIAARKAKSAAEYGPDISRQGDDYHFQNLLADIEKAGSLDN
jgi:hypothetical protein